MTGQQMMENCRAHAPVGTAPEYCSANALKYCLILFLVWGLSTQPGVSSKKSANLPPSYR